MTVITVQGLVDRSWWLKGREGRFGVLVDRVELVS